MGEMADYINEYDPESDFLLYEYGGSKSCRCCGKINLHWQQYDGKWRLFESNGCLHNCKSNPLKD
jgi:hypothetical protein